MIQNEKLYSGMVLYRAKGFYQLVTEDFGELTCKGKGSLFQKSKYQNQISVGDNVLFSKKSQDDVGLIKELKPRKSFFCRARVEKNVQQILSANIDILLIIASYLSPPFRINLVLRMMVAAYSGNITPILVISKSDLASENELESLSQPFQSCGIEVIHHSKYSETYSSRLDQIFETQVCTLAGHSGVGKSSMLNQIVPGLDLKTGSLNRKTQKGSHTTTYSQMFKVSENGYVIDTPGIREFGLWEVTQKNLDQYFPKMNQMKFQCKHKNCSHIHEPKCSVKNEVETGTFPGSIYKGYVDIYDSLNVIKRGLHLRRDSK